MQRISSTVARFVPSHGLLHGHGRRRNRRTVVVATLAAFAAAPVFGQMSTQTEAEPVPVPVIDQFEPYQLPGFPFDNVQGEIVNLETQLIKPVVATADGEEVWVANEPDGRVVVLTADLATVLAEIAVGQGIAALAERPGLTPDQGEIWVSVRHQSSVVVIGRASKRVEALLRPPIPATATGARHAARPGGIAFNADGSKAYVPAGDTDRLAVYDAGAKTHLTNVNLRAVHNGRQSKLEEPMAVLSDGALVYVVSHSSGNQTIVDTDAGTFPASGLFGPGTVFVKDLDTDPNRSLPDFDVMIVDTASDQVIGQRKAVGTTLFGIALHPDNGRLVVANLEAFNGDFIGEGSFAEGRVVENRLTYVDPSGSPASYIYTVTENLGPTRVRIVLPTDVEIGPSSMVAVAGTASSNIGLFDGDGNFVAVMKAAAGPRGLSWSPVTQRLYAYNRIANSVSYHDFSGGIPSGTAVEVALTDPTFDRVRDGRAVFHDPSNSGAGTTGCFSCHQDLRKDRLGWQLGKFFDQGTGFSNGNEPTEWKDRKGVMVTQDMRSLADVPPYHWRGEQKDLEDFNGAFEGLLKGRKLGDEAFALFKDYSFSAVYPPNSFQQMNRVFTAAADSGLSTFLSGCDRCHQLPPGTDAGITEGLFGLPASPLAMKTTQLRGVRSSKISGLTNIVDDTAQPEDLYPVTGFGLFHEGNIDGIFEFVDFFFNLGQPATDNVTDFVRQFDTGLAPATSHSELLNAATAGSTRIGSYLIDQANNGNCDLAARGRLLVNDVWQDVGLVWDPDPGAQHFIADRASAGGPFTFADLDSKAASGAAELLFFGVPVWSGERFGVDRDRDGVFDGDEAPLGLDETDPDSNDDGLWDICDPSPGTPGCSDVAGAPTVDVASVKGWVVTTNSFKITYETDGLTPTLVEFGPDANYGFFTGDPDPLPARSNLWKRKHTAILRPQPGQGLLALDDNAPLHFRIHTRGQNGIPAVTGDFTTVDSAVGPITVSTIVDNSNPNIRVGSIDVTAQRNGAQVDYTATVTVIDNDGAPIQGATVNGRFTYFSGANITHDEPSGTTDLNGVVVLTGSEVQAVGDRTFFDVPMTLNGSAGVVQAGVLFSWPEGPSCVETVAP